MPFTPSHAAAVLPLRRGPLVLPALVAGSFAPDLGFFLYLLPRQPLDRDFTHSLAGTVVAGIPSALALLLALRLVAAPIVALAPPRVQPALVGLLGRPRWSWWLLPSAWVGALTHVLWDACTHVNGPVVLRVPLLQAELLPGLGLYAVLQYASSVLGLAVLAVVLRRWYARADRRDVPVRLQLPGPVRATVWATVAWAGLLAAVRYGSTPRDTYAGLELLRATATRVAIGSITGSALALLVWALVWHLGRASRTGPHSSTWRR